MPGWPEISSSIYGAYRLARLDAGGLGYFNMSVDGFWRSFFAAVIVAPAYVIIVLLRDAADPADAATMTPEITAYVIGWIFWPLIMLVVARLFGLLTNFVGYIIVYNWSNVIQVAVLLPIALITESGGVPEAVAPVLTMIATVYVLFYLWFVARTALGAASWTAAAIVVLDVISGLLLSRGVEIIFA